MTAPEQPVLQQSLRDQLGALPATIQAEVAAWVEVLEGRWGRSGPHHRDTVRIYVKTVMPALVEWSTSCASLREIVTDDVEARLAPMTGARRVLTAVAFRSLFGALKARRRVFVDPARAVPAGTANRNPVLGLDALSRFSLLETVHRADHRLVVLLAGVHAMTRADIIGTQLDEVDLDSATITVRGTKRPLSPMVEDHVIAWLRARSERWPRSANPHLLVTNRSAYGVGPVSTGFVNFPTTAGGLRADRLLAEANDSRGDPLRLVRLFGLSPACAVRYCAGFDAEAEMNDL